jgi:hypothetical protein
MLLYRVFQKSTIIARHKECFEEAFPYRFENCVLEKKKTRGKGRNMKIGPESFQKKKGGHTAMGGTARVFLENK